MDSHRWPERGGFSRVGLVVVIVVLLLVIGFGVVFIYQARTSREATVARIRTANHLSQLGLAIINYDSTAGRLPIGYDAKTKKSFYFEIREHIEADAYCDMQGGQAKTFAYFLCPTRRSPQTCKLGLAPADFGYAMSTEEAKTLLGGDPDTSGLTYADIRDGASNTVLLTLISIKPSEYGGTDGVDSPWTTTNYGREQGRLILDDQPEAGPPRLGGPNYKFGTQAVFADRSVRLISHDLDERHLRFLWTFNGGGKEVWTSSVDRPY